MARTFPGFAANDQRKDLVGTHASGVHRRKHRGHTDQLCLSVGGGDLISS